MIGVCQAETRGDFQPLVLPDACSASIPATRGRRHTPLAENQVLFGNSSETDLQAVAQKRRLHRSPMRAHDFLQKAALSQLFQNSAIHRQECCVSAPDL